MKTNKTIKLALIDGEWHLSTGGRFWAGMSLHTEADFMGSGRGERKNETPNGTCEVLYYEPANPVKL